MNRIDALAGLLLATFSFGEAHAEAPVAGAGFGATPIAECKTDLNYLNQVTGWQTSWPAEWSRIAAAPGDAAAQEAALARWRAAPAALDADVAALARGVKARRTAPRAVVARVLQQARDLRDRIDDSTAGYAPAADSEFATRWRMLLHSDIAPAIDRYAAFLETDYLPKASSKSALATLKDGGRCFSEAAKFWTTLSMTGDEIERAGERILGETRAQLLALSATNETLPAVLERLRTTTQIAPVSSAELIALSEAALQRANAKLAGYFLAPPEGQVSVVEMAAHLQPSFPAGFYQPAGDGEAAYVINTSRPADRRLMAETIAFHEAVPGHHLFFAYPRATAEGAFNAGLVEGWAIYAETLADEMGLYAATLDREGMHAKHLWSASRLVIEPRLHSGRWTREDAIRFMRKSTALPEEEIALEIDRYLAMPGQSLSYSLGADAILRARSRAVAALGDRFDIKKFHDVVVGPGLRPLAKIDADVDAWIEATKAEAAR